VSWAKRDGYRIGLEREGRSMLTKLKCGIGETWFTINELEVWEIIFEK